MVDFRVLITVVLAITGFGLVSLLGALLPNQLDDEDDKGKDSKN